LPSGTSYDVLPFYLPDPKTKETVTIIGVSSTNGQKTKFTPQQVNINIRNMFTNMAFPEIAEGYVYPPTGLNDELTKMVFGADPSMPERMNSFINGDISALDGKRVLLVLDK